MGGLTDGETYRVTYAMALESTVTAHQDESKTVDNGKLSVNLYPGEAVTVHDLPVGTMPTVAETDPVGYAVSWDGDLVSSATSQSTASVQTAEIDMGGVTVVCTNTTGAVLPSTGGMGIWLYVFPGILLMLGAGVLLLNQRSRREEPDGI